MYWKFARVLAAIGAMLALMVAAAYDPKELDLCLVS